LSVGLAVDRVVYLLTMDGDFLGCHDTEPNLVPPDFDHRDGDVVIDYNALIFFSGQYKHRRLSFLETKEQTLLYPGSHASLVLGEKGAETRR
jgi:hypothetical protein